MNPTSRPVPRVLPTLTQIIEPSSVELELPIAAGLDETVAHLTQRGQIDLARRLRADMSSALEALIDEHLQKQLARAMQDLGPLLRQAVLDAQGAAGTK